MKDVVFEVVEEISKAGKPYKALRITLHNVSVGDEVIEELPLQPIFLDTLTLVAIKSKLNIK